MTSESLTNCFPNIVSKDLNAFIKYQYKFSLTLENLKCLNPDCNNNKKWSSTKDGPNQTCSSECKNIMNDEIIRLRSLKAKDTYFTRTGYENPALNPETWQKKQKSSLLKYGTNSPNSNPQIKAKQKLAIYTKYGCSLSANLGIKQKKISTNLNRYGAYYPNSNPQIKAKQKLAIYTKYGCSISANLGIKQKKIESSLLKYGTNNPTQQHLTNFKNWDNKQFWLDNFIFNKQNFNYLKCMNYFSCKQPAAHNQIKKLGIVYTRLGGTSLKEQALYPMLDDLNIKYVTNTKAIIKPMELDIYLPDLKLAIEYNGSYWHSYHPEVGTSPKQTDCNQMKYRHQQKSIACIEAGIRLLHIYEHESEEMLLNKLESFLLYDPETDINNEWDLDTGCYPLGLEYDTIEPEAIIILNGRVIWNAGKINLKGNKNARRN